MAWLVFYRSAPFLALPLAPHRDLIWELGIGPLGRPVHGIIGGARKLSHVITPTNGVDFLITAAVLYPIVGIAKMFHNSFNWMCTFSMHPVRKPFPLEVL